MTCWKEISVWYWNEFYRKSQLNCHQTCYRMLEMYGISNAHNWLFTHIGSRPRSHIRWYVYYVPQFFPLNNSIFPLIEYHSFNCFFHSARYFFSFCIAKLFYHTLLKIKEKISWRRKNAHYSCDHLSVGQFDSRERCADECKFYWIVCLFYVILTEFWWILEFFWAIENKFENEKGLNRLG